MKRFLIRHQPAVAPSSWFIAGIGGIIAIGLLGALTTYSSAFLLMAPFGASCVLLFSVPASPLSQPMNVVGGHLLATAIALAATYLLPDTWWAVAIAVGLAIAAMGALRVTHPPAGADPIVVFALNPGTSFLIITVLLGSLLLVVTATVFHRVRGVQYPLPEN